MMKKIEYFKEWIYCDNFLFNTKSKQLIDVMGQEINKEFLNSKTFNDLLRRNSFPLLKKSSVKKILALEITQNCNYKCKYCFEGNNILSKSGILDFNVACIYLDKLPFGSQIRFFGGEPLMYFNLVKKIVKKYPQHSYSLVTNGSLITEKIAEFLTENNFSVGLSYDGYGWQNKNRISKNNNSQSDFEKAVHILSRAGCHVGISSVITKESIPYLYDIHLEVFDDYPISGWAYLLGYNSDMTLYDLDIFKENLFRIIDEFPVKHLLKINDLKKWSMKISGEWPIDGFCGAGSYYSALTSNGEEKFCTFFLRESSCYTPSIGLIEVDCKRCSIWEFCKGGCRALNMFSSGSVYKSHPFSCKKNHIYFEAGLKVRIKLAKELKY